MTHPPTRRAILAGLASTFAAPTAFAQSAAAPTRSLRPVARVGGGAVTYQPPLSAIIDQARLSGAVSAQVADVKTGVMLEAHNPQGALPPASVAKAITACYALDVLGPGYHFTTRVLATAPLRNGRIEGDVILVGGGDPTLTTDDLAQIAKRLREEAGVIEVTGRFLVWENALPTLREIDQTQPDHVSYNPGLSGLNLNFNRVYFEWKRAGAGYSVSMDARTAKLRPVVRSARMRIVDRAHPVYAYSDRGTFEDWSVAHSALGKEGARWLPVRRPAQYAAEVFQILARSNGIVLKDAKVITALPAGAYEIVAHQSAPLRVILRDMLRYSTNLTAECVGMTASVLRTGSVGSLSASAHAMNIWAKSQLGMRAVALSDHSGLSGASRVSGHDMVTGLIAARKRMGIKALLKQHPIRNEARQILKDHPLTVQAKTGTLNFVSGLGGFIDLPDGTELAFACFSADLPRRNALRRDERDKPPGGRTYAVASRKLQQRLLHRWGSLYNG